MTATDDTSAALNTHSLLLSSEYQTPRCCEFNSKRTVAGIMLDFINCNSFSCERLTNLYNSHMRKVCWLQSAILDVVSSILHLHEDENQLRGVGVSTQC
jgi:hypothetical protein